ncbi:hypothetical protein LshimejAT787_1204340 [Lyophyllum shimeji]|uniref:Uncharacterized protein n=1 Tax=Lyophyllum shimeji TaxID=47721 RepID=A0A9P3USX6_LYOSH|nr:hypothetical protein LshimejAT787_1204340 [Lyophyllum shimeji]
MFNLSFRCLAASKKNSHLTEDQIPARLSYADTTPMQLTSSAISVVSPGSDLQRGKRTQDDDSLQKPNTGEYAKETAKEFLKILEAAEEKPVPGVGTAVRLATSLIQTCEVRRSLNLYDTGVIFCAETLIEEYNGVGTAMLSRGVDAEAWMSRLARSVASSPMQKHPEALELLATLAMLPIGTKFETLSLGGHHPFQTSWVLCMSSARRPW